MAASLFAAAVIYLLSALSAAPALTASSATLAALASLRILRSVDAEPQLSKFQPFDVQLLFDAADELLLTDKDRLVPPAGGGEDELLLDDVIEPPGPDSRVVQLFGRRAVATPGEMKAQIDRHLRRATHPNAAPDASQELIEALAELRRSLR